MKVTDNYFEKNFVIETKDPYLTSLKIMDRMRDFYNVSEKQNEYKTDGPENMSIVEFVINKDVDEFTHIKMEFSMRGQNKKLNMHITGSIILVLDNYGFFTESFSVFYIEKLYKETKKKCEDAVESIKKRFDRIIEAS